MIRIEPKEISNIRDSDYIGIEWESGNKTIVMERDKNEFISSNLHYENNALCKSWSRCSKASYCNTIFKTTDSVVYKFDNYREIFKWFIDGRN